MRILVVEDDKKIASFVANGLREAGFVVDHSDNGFAGLQHALRQPYDAAVVDVMLPKLDGLSLIERLRDEKILTPVLILSAKRSVDDRVRGLQTGGDDYLTKPFSFSELLARVQALIRRAGREPEPTWLEVGDLTMNLLTREVRRAGKKSQSATPRVRPVAVSVAQSQPGSFQDHDHRACVGLRFRSFNQHRRCAGLPATQ